MDSFDLERRRKAWSSYWASGGLHSCIGRLADDPDGAIGRFWHACFAALREGDRVLDLATGNGALPRLLLDSVPRDTVRVDAVDLATLAPAWHSSASLPWIAFHSGVRMEALPFADGTFELVVSQFGLEYAQWPQALDEAARVGTADGRHAFVLHHEGSLVVRLGKAERQHQRFLLAEDGLLAVAEDLQPHLARIRGGAAPDAAATRLREAYNAAMRRLSERIELAEAPDLLAEARDRVHAILAGRFGMDSGTQAALLQDYRAALNDASVRTCELIECGLDESRAADLVQALRDRLPGRGVSASRLEQGGDLVAWAVVAS